jgi:hypothetical protein
LQKEIEGDNEKIELLKEERFIIQTEEDQQVTRWKKVKNEKS